MGWIDYRDKGRQVVIGITILVALLLILGGVAINGLKRLGEDSSSLYQKELIPALDMSHILENLYQNRVFLEEHIIGVTKETSAALEARIQRNSNQIDSIVQKYFDISVVGKEDRLIMQDFNNAIHKYRTVENQILKLSRQGEKEIAEQIYEDESYVLFQKSVEPILFYSNKSLQEGKRLYLDAVEVSENMRLILYICMSLAIIDAIVIGIIMSRAYLD